jgi:Macrocin-O-methyltransferase (TylF)
VKNFVRLCWIKFGSLLPRWFFVKARVWLEYLYFGYWLRHSEYRPKTLVPEVKKVFATVAEPFEDQPVLYMEFGVFEGTSMRLWSRLLKNPSSKLIGFDSFEGLPEDYSDATPKGMFAVGRKPPTVPDGRVSFVVGYFDQSLPTFQIPSHDQLIIFMDADLYSSTIYVLRRFRESIVVGTIIIFGQFSDNRNHELKAFEEFRKETAMKFELLVIDYSHLYPAFRRVA